MVPVAEVAELLDGTGYQGWFVLEDESELAERDPDGVAAQLGQYVDKVLRPLCEHTGRRVLYEKGEAQWLVTGSRRTWSSSAVRTRVSKRASRSPSELGYEWVEPMVHTGWELLSEVHYFHSFSMEEDPLLMREICDRYGVKVSSISGHSPLMKPEAAVPRLTRAIVLADAVGAGFVNSDEMVKPDWMDDAHAHEVMRYSLEKAALVAARHGVYVCIEPHGIYTQTSEGLLRIVDLVPSPWIQVNWDTGNAYIAGAEDPYEGLERALPAGLPRARQGHLLRAERRPGHRHRHPGRVRLRRGRGRLGAGAPHPGRPRPGDNPQRRVRHHRPGRAQPQVPLRPHRPPGLGRCRSPERLAPKARLVPLYLVSADDPEFVFHTQRLRELLVDEAELTDPAASGGGPARRPTPWSSPRWWGRPTAG